MKRVKIRIYQQSDGRWHLSLKIGLLGFLSVLNVETECDSQDECMEHVYRIVREMGE